MSVSKNIDRFRNITTQSPHSIDHYRVAIKALLTLVKLFVCVSGSDLFASQYAERGFDSFKRGIEFIEQLYTLSLSVTRHGTVAELNPAKEVWDVDVAGGFGQMNPWR